MECPCLAEQHVCYSEKPQCHRYQCLRSKVHAYLPLEEHWFLRLQSEVLVRQVTVQETEKETEKEKERGQMLPQCMSTQDSQFALLISALCQLLRNILTSGDEL